MILDNNSKAKNADKLEGKTAEEWLSEWTLSAYPINSDDELLACIESYSANMESQTKYSLAINMRYDNPGYLGGGIWEVEGFKTNENYEFQLFIKYSSSSGALIHARSKNNGAWGEFVALVTNIGGYIGNKSKTATYSLTIFNSLRTVLLQMLDTGAFRFYDATNAKAVFTSALDGTNTFHGKASECLPLDGSVTMTGEIKLPYGNSRIGAWADNFYLTVCNKGDVNTNRQLVLGNQEAMTLDTCLFLRETKNNSYIDYSILHKGNSAAVVISDTAPSDTSALWVVPNS